MERVLPAETLDRDLVEFLMGATAKERSLDRCPLSEQLRWRIPLLDTLSPWPMPAVKLSVSEANAHDLSESLSTGMSTACMLSLSASMRSLLHQSRSELRLEVRRGAAAPSCAVEERGVQAGRAGLASPKRASSRTAIPS
eukprot:3642537-Rhodomonas_salina.1